MMIYSHVIHVIAELYMCIYTSYSSVSRSFLFSVCVCVHVWSCNCQSVKQSHMHATVKPQIVVT